MTLALWRISNYPTLDGAGGRLASGRWHFCGVEVVYLAESPALAILEVMVNLEIDFDELPASYTLLEARAAPALAEDLPVDPATGIPDGLDTNWTDRELATQELGQAWINACSASLLRVPSAVAPFSHNYLLNPRHPDAPKVRIYQYARHPWDQRLFRAP